MLPATVSFVIVQMLQLKVCGRYTSSSFHMFRLPHILICRLDYSKQNKSQYELVFRFAWASTRSALCLCPALLFYMNGKYCKYFCSSKTQQALNDSKPCSACSKRSYS